MLFTLEHYKKYHAKFYRLTLRRKDIPKLNINKSKNDTTTVDMPTNPLRFLLPATVSIVHLRVLHSNPFIPYILKNDGKRRANVINQAPTISPIVVEYRGFFKGKHTTTNLKYQKV